MEEYRFGIHVSKLTQNSEAEYYEIAALVAQYKLNVTEDANIRNALLGQTTTTTADLG